MTLPWKAAGSDSGANLKSHSQTRENYDTFTVIIPGNILKVSRRYASEFQSQGRKKKLKDISPNFDVE